MSFVATAVIGAAVVGAGAAIYASNKSANAITSSTNASINAQETAQERQQALNAPYAAIGTGGAISQYQNLLGLGGAGAAGEQKALAQTPGYQFTQSQGQQGTINAASAMGLGLSGNTLEGLDTFNTGLADQTYEQAVQNSQNAVAIGQNAAAGTGAGILSTGANVGSTISNAGNTLAGIDANETAGVTKALSGSANQFVTLNTLQGLNNPASTDPVAYGNPPITQGPGGYLVNTPGYGP